VRPARAFVDSSAWIAFFSARDQNHRAADALFRQAIARRVPLLTTNLIVAEVHRLVLHRAGPPAAAAVLARIEGSPQVRLVFATAAHHQAARAWLARLSDQVITYTDAVSFAVMQAERCSTVASFDHDFVLAGFEVWSP
jgi:predicted nucleic acid-binding protein